MMDTAGQAAQEEIAITRLNSQNHCHLLRTHYLAGLPWCLRGKESACQCRKCGFDSGVRKIPQRMKWQPTPVYLPGKPHGCSPPGSSVHGDSSGKNTGVDCHALLQGIFPNQGSNPGLPHCSWILYHLNHQGSEARGGLQR